jgi:hypothetical protein
MAQQDYSGVITLAVIAGAAWYAYEQGWLSSLFGIAAPATTGTPAAAINCPSPNTLIAGVCTAPFSCPSPNTMVNGVCTAPVSNTSTPAAPITTAPQPIPTAAYTQTDQPWAMQMAALSSSNTLDVDQWNYYFNQLASTTWAGTLSPISGTQMSAMLAALAALGQTRSTPMTLPQWYWLVTTGGGGLSGLGSFGDYLGIPAGMIHGGW